MIKIKNYYLQSEIGSGKYGKVYKGKNLLTEEIVAIKKIQKNLIRNEIIKELIQQEISCMKLLKSLQTEKQNENIIQFIEFIESQSSYYLIMEYCNDGDLKELLTKIGHFSEDSAIKKFNQLLNGFKLFDENQIMHRDIKTANIFLHNNCLKIGDFGFACQQEFSQLKLGTPLYMAPELLRAEKYDNKVDIWALGVIFYQLLFGIFPFKADKNNQLQIYETTKPDFTYNNIKISTQVQQLIEKMLALDKNDRISWKELFNYKLDLSSLKEAEYFQEQSLKTQFSLEKKAQANEWQDETNNFTPYKKSGIENNNTDVGTPENLLTVNNIRQIQNFEGLSHCLSLQTSCSEMRKISQQTFDAIIQDDYDDE